MTFSASFNHLFRGLWAGLIAIFMAVSVAAGVSESELQNKMKDSLNNATAVLKEGGENSIIAKKLFDIFDPFFDYKLMSRLSLGGLSQALSADEMGRFNKAFEANLKRSFTEKLSFYSGQEIALGDAKKPNEKRIFLNASLVNKNDKLDIVFKFHRKSADDFYIYDIDIAGISVIQTYRAQFEGLGNGAKFEQILGRLEAVKFGDDK